MTIEAGFDTEVQMEALHRLHEAVGEGEDFLTFVGTRPLIELSIGTTFIRGMLARERMNFEDELNRAGLLVPPPEE